MSIHTRRKIGIGGGEDTEEVGSFGGFLPSFFHNRGFVVRGLVRLECRLGLRHNCSFWLNIVDST